MRLTTPRIGRERAAVPRACFLQPPDPAQRIAEIGTDAGVARLQLHAAAETGDGLFRTSAGPQCDAEIDPGGGMVRREAQDMAITGDRLGQAPGPMVAQSRLEAARGHARRFEKRLPDRTRTGSPGAPTPR